MTEAQALDLLASNGRLVKRPIAVDGDRVTVGFNEAEYKKTWAKK
jgi:arsenate reductase